MRNNQSIFARIDWILVLLYLALVLLGWGNIYAAVYNEEFSSIFDISQEYGRQMLWIGTSVVIIILVMMTDTSIYQTLAWPIYIIMLALLAGVLVFGKEVAGARSWYAIGSFSLQPSEFAKFATALAVTKFLGAKDVSLDLWRNRFVALIIILVPAAIIVPQPDPGSALVYSAFFLVFYREGLPGGYIFLGFTLVVLFILSLLIDTIYLFSILGVVVIIAIIVMRRTRGSIIQIIGITLLCVGFIQSVDYAFNNVLEDRHRNRINILLGKAHDPKGIGYNTNQSMIAIGSGGLTGKGYLEGTQTKYDFVPEQSTDFIFCTVGEEWGFVGSSAVIILFVILLFRLIIVAERQKSPFARIYGYSVACIIFFHFAINIAMTIGLAPVVGIPLPFFSYGGSSLWGFTLLYFIFVKLDAGKMDQL